MNRLRQQISEFLGFSIPETPVPFVTHNVVEEHGYRRTRISYASPGSLPNSLDPLRYSLYEVQHFKVLYQFCTFPSISKRDIIASQVEELFSTPFYTMNPTLKNALAYGSGLRSFWAESQLRILSSQKPPRESLRCYGTL